MLLRTEEASEPGEEDRRQINTAITRAHGLHEAYCATGFNLQPRPPHHSLP